MPCPKTFHLCPRSASDGFCIVDRETGEETEVSTCAEARRVAKDRYPDCEFALSTIHSIHKDAPPGMPDAVLVAILKPIDDNHGTVLAYIVASVEGTGCIPFAAEVWKDVKDHLPYDHRRKAVH